mmetsp:Transcript_12475/g.52289  ORF Transcript_12475/g.52289 Transcript_12475/m.52289 type:complete len:85 (-) Transcript_12475:729-983(-)
MQHYPTSPIAVRSIACHLRGPPPASGHVGGGRNGNGAADVACMDSPSARKPPGGETVCSYSLSRSTPSRKGAEFFFIRVRLSAS